MSTKQVNAEPIDSISASRKRKIRLLNALMIISFVLILAILVFIIGYILFRGLPNITWELLSTEPSVLRNTYGILPNILNTLYMVIMTLIIVLPIGVCAAIYLNEYATNVRLVQVIEFATEGLAGMLIFCQFFGLDTGLLAGALTLVIMTLPTIIRTTQESLKTVPDSYREGALALGAGKWHMIRTVVLPSAIDGIVTGCILAVGRIVGESAALLFTAGMANKILSFKQAITPGTSGATLTVAMYMYAMERNRVDVAFAIAAILLLLTLLINFFAKFAASRLKKNVE